MDGLASLTFQAVGRIVALVDGRTSETGADVDWYRRTYAEPSEAKVATHRMVGGIPVALPPGAELQRDPQLEEEAKANLCNISPAERRLRLRTARRFALGTLGLMGALVAAGDRVPRYARVVISTPLGLAIGFYSGAALGICGISHQRLWDPDGQGVRPAPKDIAEAIWARAKLLYASQIIVTAAATSAFIFNPWF